jgi:redox-sensitive bicupin YhaK (pirin superfamily)
MDHAVRQTVALGGQWPTLDPFLFCAHHRDAYPAGNARLGPAAPLEGRQLGQDFAGRDGWNMYHGTVVPGFPAHPHRGFETVTYLRRGIIDHADSLGAAARFGRGDVQWMTAGAGVVHSEMFPLLDPDGPNPLELFQIWLNLPARDKLVEPHFAMLWDRDIPRLRTGDGVEVTVIAGPLGDRRPPPPPPHSWASRAAADVAIWHLTFAVGARWTLPPAQGPETVRTLYLFEGDGLAIEGRPVAGSTGAVVAPDRPLALEAVAGPAEVLVLQGRPIGEPVAQYGPFVMNDRAGVEQALRDYQRTGFGRWPWDSEQPVHGGRGQGRFARHADGRVEHPEPVPAT